MKVYQMASCRRALGHTAAYVLSLLSVFTCLLKQPIRSLRQPCWHHIRDRNGYVILY